MPPETYHKLQVEIATSHSELVQWMHHCMPANAPADDKQLLHGLCVQLQQLPVHLQLQQETHAPEKEEEQQPEKESITPVAHNLSTAALDLATECHSDLSV